MRLEAITWERLTDSLADRLLQLSPADGAPWPRVAFDGAPAARPGDLAARVGEALRVRGRSALVVGTQGFLRPASLRFEYGHEDVEAYYSGWFDTAALWREVFGPLEAGGTGRVLPDLWDPVSDRATRSPYVHLPPGGLLLLHGPLLFGHWFPFDLTVHVRLSPGALATHATGGTVDAARLRALRGRARPRGCRRRRHPGRRPPAPRLERLIPLRVHRPSGAMTMKSSGLGPV